MHVVQNDAIYNNPIKEFVLTTSTFSMGITRYLSPKALKIVLRNMILCQKSFLKKGICVWEGNIYVFIVSTNSLIAYSMSLRGITQKWSYQTAGVVICKSPNGHKPGFDINFLTLSVYDKEHLYLNFLTKIFQKSSSIIRIYKTVIFPQIDRYVII
jgi:hypothetical protein